MNEIVRSKAFKSGNSVAVRLPRSFGIEAGADLTLEQCGREITVKREFDQEEWRRKQQAMFDRIAATPLERDPDIFPDRPGLYGPEQE